ncbi:oligosaccharide repeat unit polymerase [Caenimonas terrae]|uniref:Oligosaccharide repeat unit polymerase n=1 Tax=Caenimonas terrae TaxID=696074 RepID=A0ABW0NEI6_9BURK
MMRRIVNFENDPAFKGLVAVIALYIFANIYSAISSLANAGVFTGGDFEGFRSDAVVILINLFLVILFYLASVFLYRNLKGKFREAELFPSNVMSLGWFVAAIQIIFFLYLTFGEVGLDQLKGQASFASYFQYLFVPDYLFLTYYAFGRGARLFYPNLLLYLASTSVRGVSGGFIFLIFFEVVAAFQKSKWTLVSLALLIIVLLSPFIYELRNLVRSASPAYLFSTPWSELAATVFESAYLNIHFLDSLHDVGDFVLMRLQHLSSPVAIYNHLDLFWLGDIKGTFLSFLFDGGPQRSLLGESFYSSPLLSEYLTISMFPTPYGSWFTHPSLVGWLWVDPFSFPLLVVYCIALLSLNLFLVKKIGGDAYALACSFIFFLVFIMNGWFGPYISTIQAFVILLVLSRVARAARNFSSSLARSA